MLEWPAQHELQCQLIGGIRSGTVHCSNIPTVGNMENAQEMYHSSHVACFLFITFTHQQIELSHFKPKLFKM